MHYNHIFIVLVWIINILPEKFRAVHFWAALMDLYNMIIYLGS